MAFLENVGALLVLIGIMILIHELGHYWAARIFDVHVEAFSIGFGPRLFGFRRASKYRPAVANGVSRTYQAAISPFKKATQRLTIVPFQSLPATPAIKSRLVLNYHRLPVP